MLSIALLLSVLVLSFGCGTTRTIDLREEEDINDNPCDGEYPHSSPPTDYTHSQYRMANATNKRVRTKICVCHSWIFWTTVDCRHEWSNWEVERRNKPCYRATTNCSCSHGENGGNGSCPADNGSGCTSCSQGYALEDTNCVEKVVLGGNCNVNGVIKTCVRDHTCQTENFAACQGNDECTCKKDVARNEDCFGGPGKDPKKCMAGLRCMNGNEPCLTSATDTCTCERIPIGGTCNGTSQTALCIEGTTCQTSDFEDCETGQTNCKCYADIAPAGNCVGSDIRSKKCVSGFTCLTGSNDPCLTEADCTCKKVPTGKPCGGNPILPCSDTDSCQTEYFDDCGVNSTLENCTCVAGVVDGEDCFGGLGGKAKKCVAGLLCLKANDENCPDNSTSDCSCRGVPTGASCSRNGTLLQCEPDNTCRTETFWACEDSNLEDCKCIRDPVPINGSCGGDEQTLGCVSNAFCLTNDLKACSSGSHLDDCKCVSILGYTCAEGFNDEMCQCGNKICAANTTCSLQDEEGNGSCSVSSSESGDSFIYFYYGAPLLLLACCSVLLCQIGRKQRQRSEAELSLESRVEEAMKQRKMRTGSAKRERRTHGEKERTETYREMRRSHSSRRNRNKDAIETNPSHRTGTATASRWWKEALASFK